MNSASGFSFALHSALVRYRIEAMGHILVCYVGTPTYIVAPNPLLINPAIAFSSHTQASQRPSNTLPPAFVPALRGVDCSSTASSSISPQAKTFLGLFCLWRLCGARVVHLVRSTEIPFRAAGSISTEPKAQWVWLALTGKTWSDPNKHSSSSITNGAPDSEVIFRLGNSPNNNRGSHKSLYLKALSY